MLAKLGSDYKKPDAVTVIDREHFKSMVWGLPASDMLMVGRSTRRELARMGILPAGMYRNRTYAEHAVDAGDTELAKQDMLFDPQTAGGLLIAVAEKDADALMNDLRGAVPSAQRIGYVSEYQGGARIKLAH